MGQPDRQLEVSEAAWRVIVREGLDRASMRAIAQEMHCTTGVVTHYFRNKEELILFALHQVTARLQALLATAIENKSGLERLVAMLSSFLPADPERAEILRVWVAFLGYAVGREQLMAEHQQSAGQLRQIILQELQALQDQQLIDASLNLELETNTLLALANGLSLDTLIQSPPLSLEQQQLVLRHHVYRFQAVT